MENKDQYKQLSEAQYDCLLFDVDDTLYPISSGLSKEVTKYIQEYMIQRLGIEGDKVPEICLSLYQKYGTTMAGLRATGYEFEDDDYNSYLYSRLPYNVLKPDPVLRSLLLSLPIRKIIFSNADKVHVNRVLHGLGLEDCFEQVICFESLNHAGKGDGKATNSGNSPMNLVICKPLEEAFEKVSEIANIDPQKTLFFDDNLLNLQSGKAFGLKTVRVGSSQRSPGVDYALDSIHNIREALPELWRLEEDSDAIEYSRNVPIETYVRA